MPSENISIDFSPNSEFFATIGDSGTHINIWDTTKFSNVLKIFCNQCFIKSIKFAQNNQELFVRKNNTRPY